MRGTNTQPSGATTCSIHLVGRCWRYVMALEPIETAQLWVATVAGLAGLAGVLWQVYQHFSGRKEATNMKLNKTVLKPWSHVKIVSLYDHDQYNRIMLGIPKEALPSDVAHSSGEQGLDVQRLPGLSTGEVFLRKHYPDVFSLWVEVRRLQERYEGLLQHRRTIVEPMVRAGMLRFYPSLTPVQSWTEKEYRANTYILKHIVADVEMIGFWAAKDGEIRLNVQESKTQADVLYVEYRASNLPWLKVVAENAIDRALLEKRVSSWITEHDVQKAKKELFDILQKLE